ncbi:MAG: type II secretion system F family protein [Candidatus Aenigmarchaeota archaeon]|nr:type II secretion system F family protein [Candidatus Aenigmarchaeota archaeon]
MKTKLSPNDQTMICIILGVIILAINVQFFSQSKDITFLLNVAGVLVALGFPVYVRYMKFHKIKNIEEIFPTYLNDIAAKISTGMTLPQAIKTVSFNEYGDLNPYAKEIYAKINWGIPFSIVLNEFAENIGSKEMRRNVQTIIETHKSGGEIDVVLQSVSQSLQELEKIKKERWVSVYSQIINGYIIYFVFLGVMIGLTTFLLPAFQHTGEVSVFQFSMNSMFQNLAIIQGFFAGLAIGKLSEGSVISGVKHSIALSFVGYVAFFFLL